MISSLDAKTVVTNYASCWLALGKKTIYLPKLPHMAKMYSQLPNLGQMAKICCMLMKYKYEVYHGFDTTILHNDTILYDSLYCKIYLGQMKKIRYILMWYKYEVYHGFDTTTLQKNVVLYDGIYHNIYMYIGIQVYKVY